MARHQVQTAIVVRAASSGRGLVSGRESRAPGLALKLSEVGSNDRVLENGLSVVGVVLAGLEVREELVEGEQEAALFAH